jgi:hypothetical protein
MGRQGPYWSPTNPGFSGISIPSVEEIYDLTLIHRNNISAMKKMLAINFVIVQRLEVSYWHRTRPKLGRPKYTPKQFTSSKALNQLTIPLRKLGITALERPHLRAMTMMQLLSFGMPTESCPLHRSPNFHSMVA